MGLLEVCDWLFGCLEVLSQPATLQHTSKTRGVRGRYHFASYQAATQATHGNHAFIHLLMWQPCTTCPYYLENECLKLLQA